MELIKYIFLGIIQGFTEPIPVSSSGHLLIFKELINADGIDFGLLSILTNFGSLLAIILIFKDDILDLFKSFFGYLKNKDKKYYNNYKYCWLVVLATIPAGIVGIIVTKLGIFDFLEENTKFVGVTLLITALFLFLIKDLKGKRTDGDITYKNALVVGLFQVIALIPGISRSGATIVGGMKEHFTRDTAFKFSFILYIPISLATMVLGVKDLMEANLTLQNIIYYLIAAIFAFVLTYFSSKWFRNIMKNGKLIYFVYYCLVAGTLILIFA